MKSSNGKRERSLPQNHGFHPYFSLMSEKLHRLKTWEHTGEKPPHLPGCVLITTAVYLVWIFISSSLPWSLSKGRHFQQIHLFTSLSRTRQTNFSPVFPTEVRQASPRAKLPKGPLHSQLVLAAWQDQRNPEQCLLQGPHKCARHGSK